MAALDAAFEDSLTGGYQGVLVSGAHGLGKTALVDQLRPVVTGRDGWFRGRQVRAVPAGFGVQCGFPRVSGVGPAALGRAGGRAQRGPRTDRRGGRSERGSVERGGAGVRRAVGGGARCGGSGDRAGSHAARGCAGAAGGCVAETAGRGVRRRSSVGQAYPAGLRRSRAERGPDRGPTAGGGPPGDRRGRGTSAGHAAAPGARAGRRAVAGARQPAGAEPRHHGRRDAARGPGHGGGPGRGDQ
ncbi:hypothetical protein HF577_00770 [Pseudonocardia xinjiangensis]|uniref:AAA ATPase-like protein n=1 Tax=Pseudonocardia xinjiangensis TaxID=75289 RepID=A0ABX1R5J8_9PSEU|nr:hypothetical protein [Pseudonocardia xinjiangensis]